MDSYNWDIGDEPSYWTRYTRLDEGVGEYDEPIDNEAYGAQAVEEDPARPEVVVDQPEVVVDQPEAVVDQPEAVVDQPEAVLDQPEVAPAPRVAVAGHDMAAIIKEASMDLFGVNIMTGGGDPMQPALADDEIAALMAKVNLLTKGRKKEGAIKEVGALMTGGNVTHAELYARLRTDLETGLSEHNFAMVQKYLAATREKL